MQGKKAIVVFLVSGERSKIHYANIWKVGNNFQPTMRLVLGHEHSLATWS